MTSTCRPTPSMCWQLWLSFNTIKKAAPITGAVWSVSDFNASNEPKHDWRLGDATYYYRRQHFLLVSQWTQTSLLGLFSRRHTWLKWTQTILSRWKPNLHTAASTTTKKKIEHVDVFSSKGGSVAAHLRGMRPTPSRQKDTLKLRENSNSNTNNQTLN